MTELLPPPIFEGFVTAMIVFISVGWVGIDSYRLRKLVKRGAHRDEIFGAVIGIVLASVGAIGLAKYYLHF